MPKKPETPTGFACRLKTLREAAGLTQAQLADRTGYYRFTLAKLEQGVQEPTWPTVLALAAALGVKITDFLPQEGEVPVHHGPGRPPKETRHDEAAQAEADHSKTKKKRPVAVDKPRRRSAKKPKER